MNSILDIQNLSVSYSKKLILKNIDISFFKPGQIVAILGPNASGKSTLMKTILGWVPPSSGEIFLYQKNINNMSCKLISKMIAFVSQSPSFNIQLTVFESLLVVTQCAENNFFTNPFCLKEKIEKINQIIEYLHLQSIANQSINSLSGGQVQMVSIAQALIRDPKILILDEPTSALDLYHQLKILECIYEYTKQHHILTLLSIHDINLAIRFSDQVVILNNGELFFVGESKFAIENKIIEKVYKVKSHIVHDPELLFPSVQILSSI